MPGPVAGLPPTEPWQSSVPDSPCESNVPGLYIAGTLQAGRQTDKIFIENSRDHGPRIVAHLLTRLAAPAPPSPS